MKNQNHVALYNKQVLLIEIFQAKIDLKRKCQDTKEDEFTTEIKSNTK